MNIKNHITEIATTLILIVSAIFLFFYAYYLPLMRYQESVEKLSKHYQKQKIELEKKIKEEEEKSKTNNSALNSVPKVLDAINDTCKDTNVIIRKLTPFPDNPFKFELNIITTYFKFLKILSEFEKLNIRFENISINEYETTLDNPKKVITLILKVTGDVENKHNRLEKKLEEIIMSSSSKNPFQRNMSDGKNKVTRAINLTYIYKLSSVTPIKGNPFATIDNKDYHIGNRFLDKGIIKKIERGKVWIVKTLSNGTKQEYFIGFRRKRKRKE